MPSYTAPLLRNLHNNGVMCGEICLSLTRAFACLTRYSTCPGAWTGRRGALHTLQRNQERLDEPDPREGVCWVLTWATR